MALSHGHQAVVRFVEETDPGTTPTDPAFLLFSKETQRVAIGLDKEGQESLDIGELDIDDLFTVRNAYSLEVETHIHDEDRLLDFLSRNADGTLKAYTFDIIPDQDASTPHYIRARGWRLGSLELSGGDNEAWSLTFTFIGGVIDAPTTADPGVGVGSREAKSAISDSLKTWTSGAIVVDGVAVAVIMENFNVTIDNGAEAHYTTGDKDPVPAAVTHGVRRITGTTSFSLDEGAKEHWDRVEAFAEHEIQVPFGTTSGDAILVLEGVRWPSIDLEIDTETDILMGDQDFQAKTFSTSAVA